MRGSLQPEEAPAKDMAAMTCNLRVEQTVLVRALKKLLLVRIPCRA